MSLSIRTCLLNTSISALTASQVTVGLRYLTVCCVIAGRLSAAGILNSKSSLTTATGWGDKAGLANAPGRAGGRLRDRAGGALGCQPRLHAFPKSWHLPPLLPLCSLTTSQDCKQSGHTLGFCLLRWETWSCLSRAQLPRFSWQTVTD